MQLSAFNAGFTIDLCCVLLVCALWMRTIFTFRIRQVPCCWVKSQHESWHLFNSNHKVDVVVLLFSVLLDKVMSRNQWHIGVHQRHLMFKGHWRAPHETKYGHKKKVCLDKTFPSGHFMLHFIMFLIRQMTTKASNDWCSHVMCCENVGQQNVSPFRDT